MQAEIEHALKNDRLIDITTTGRSSGQSRRIEIWFYNINGHIYISGLPGKRDWYANLLENPDFTFHLKQSAQADLAAKATPITDKAARHAVFKDILAIIDRSAEEERWVASSPLVEVHFS